MTIQRRVVFVSPDGQFHETEEAAVAYVERGEIQRAVEGILHSTESLDPSEVRGVSEALFENFNITKK